MKTKYDIGDSVKIEFKVVEIRGKKDSVLYWLEPVDYMLKSCESENPILKSVIVKEDTIIDVDSIPIKEYEKEVNRLKDEINRYKELYQFEHEQVLKVKGMLETLKSHLPKNISTNRW